MATYIATTAFIPTFLDDNGDPLNGGTLESYIAGTTTPTPTFTGEAGVSAGDIITLNARGEPETSGNTHQVWIDSAIKYDFVLKTAAGVIINSPEDVASPLLGSVASTLNIASAKALTTLTDGQAIYIRGYYAAADGGGGMYIYDASSAATANDGTVLALDTLAGRLLHGETTTVTVETFGVVGDGVADDAAALRAALNVLSGSTIELGKSETYLCLSSVVVPQNTKVEMNGSKIKFNVSGLTKCLDLRSFVSLYNGSVELAGSAYSGSGEFGCPILIGNYASGVGYSDIDLDGVEVITNRPNGNGVLVTGDSHNVRMNNIDFPDSANLGRGILVHWGGADTPTAGTTHPYNIKIENITGGALTNTSVDAGLVFLSACYNVSVKNVEAENCELRGGMFVTFAGDYGDYYAPTNVQGLNMTGIKAVNVGARAATQALMKFDNKSTIAPTNRICAGPIIENAWGETSSTSIVAIIVSNCIDALLSHSDIKGGSSCVSTGQGVSRLKIDGGVYRDSQNSCLYIQNGTTAPEDCTIEGVTAYNAGLGGGNHALILADNSERTTVKNNIVGAAAGETAVWGVRIGTASVDAVVTDNHCRGATTSAYSIGSSTTYGICKTYNGNTAVSGLTLQSGMTPQIISTMSVGSNALRECIGSAAPTAGTWNNGDRVYNVSPAAAGNAGWICVTAGTPGTWKTFADIAA